MTIGIGNEWDPGDAPEPVAKRGNNITAAGYKNPAERQTPREWMIERYGPMADKGQYTADALFAHMQAYAESLRQRVLELEGEVRRLKGL